MSTTITLIDLNFQRNVRQLHRLGARAVAELLLEISTNPGLNVLERLAAYAAIDHAVLQHAGGDHFPDQPVMLVPHSIRPKVISGLADRNDILRASLPDTGGDVA